MKKTLAFLAGLVLSCSAVGMNAFAADEPSSESAPLKANVLVTVSDGTKLALSQADVLVTDLNGDEKLSIDETLVAAHDQFFEGGAAAGYKSSEKEGYDGKSLDKLWGIENGGSYGYYVNSNSAWSLNDEVKEGDHLDAFVYSDAKKFSDVYCFFDIRENLDSKEGDSLTLKLSKIQYDPVTYAPSNVPVVGAEITIDGKGTGVLTDESGSATIILTKDSSESIKAVISAVSTKETLVPPVCLADINNNEEETESDTTTTIETSNTVDPGSSDEEEATDTETTTEAEETTEAETSSSETTSSTSSGAVNNTNSDSPKTGDAGTGAVAAVLGCTVLAAFALKRKDV